MKLTKIDFNGFKNKKGVQALTGFDIFIGPNGVGKSSVLEAVKLGIVGEINGVAKPMSIFKYSNNANDMTVGIETSNGYKVQRKYIRKEKIDKKTDELSAVYSEKLSVSGFADSESNKIKQEDISKKIGDFPIGFDFQKFEGMTDTEKRNFIISFCKSSKITEDIVKEFLEKDKPDELDDEMFYNDIVELIDGANGNTIQEKVDFMLLAAKEQCSYFKKEVERQRMSIQKLNEKKTSYSISSKGLIIDKKKAEKLNEQLIALEKELSIIQEENKRVSLNLQKITKVKEDIQVITNSKAIGDSKDIERQIQSKKKDLEKLNEKSVSIVKLLEVASKEYKELVEKVKAQRIIFDKTKSNGIELNTKFKTEVNLINQVKGTKGKCAINSSIPCNANFNSWLTAKNEEISDLVELRRLYKKNEAELNQLEAQSEKTTSNREKLIAEQQTVIKETETINRQIVELEKSLETLKNFDLVKKEKLEVKNNELLSLESDKKDIVDLTDKENSIKDIRSSISSLRTEISQKEQLQALMAQIKEANIEFDKTEKTLLIYKYLVDRIGQKGLQGEILRLLLAPIIDEVSNNLQILGVNKPFFITTKSDKDSEVFDFGVGDINFKTLSTGQKSILAIAMIIAFIRKAEVPVKILCLDNIESIDSSNRVKIITGLSDMYKANMIDNILIAGCIDEVPEGEYKVWTI